MRFFCLCLAPAIDACTVLPHAPETADEVFSGMQTEENAGGKGLNVARWLALRGERVVCGGLLGEENAKPFEEELARIGVEDRFLRVLGATRRNDSIVWPGGGFKINRVAFPETPVSTQPLLETVFHDIAAGDIAILSGSLPARADASLYATLTTALRERGAIVALDASGEALRNGLAARPHWIKPNLEEAAGVVGFDIRTDADALRAVARLRERAEHVILSAGARGAWFDERHVPAPVVDVVDPTAAGDTLLAEFCHRFFHNLPEPEARAVAAGAAACLQRGSRPPPDIPE